MIARFTIIAFVAIISSSSAQWQGQQQQQVRPPSTSNGGRGTTSSFGRCSCPTQYIPFCAIDGRQERTYSNRCELECAQKSNPGM